MKPVPIREGGRVPRRNRKEDEKTISVSRLLRTVDTSVDERLEATRAIMEGHLPCNRLRCVHGSLDAKQAFDLAVAEAHIASAEQRLYGAHIDRLRALEGSEAAALYFDEYHRLGDLYRDRLMAVAMTPAPTKHEARRKAREIGPTWMKAEGGWYDRLREGVAADMERLGLTKLT